MATKKHKIDLAKMARSNPKVDAKQVAEVRAVIRALRDAGVESARYNLASPFTRNRIIKRSRKK